MGATSTDEHDTRTHPNKKHKKIFEIEMRLAKNCGLDPRQPALSDLTVSSRGQITTFSGAQTPIIFAHSVKITLSNSDVRSKFSNLGSGTQVFQLSISWLLSSVPPMFVSGLTDINTLFVSSESTESLSRAGFRWRGDVSDRNSSA